MPQIAKLMIKNPMITAIMALPTQVDVALWIPRSMGVAFSFFFVRIGRLDLKGWPRPYRERANSLQRQRDRRGCGRDTGTLWRRPGGSGNRNPTLKPIKGLRRMAAANSPAGRGQLENERIGRLGG